MRRWGQTGHSEAVRERDDSGQAGGGQSDETQIMVIFGDLLTSGAKEKIFKESENFKV